MQAALYSFTVTLPLLLTDAEKRVRESLQREGFGIISEIDIQAKLKEKLGIEHYPHKILGACNPKLAYQALQENADVALALPCNVVLRQEKDNTIISAILPTVALEPFGGGGVKEAADAAQTALERVFNDLRRLQSSQHHSHPHP